jgi:hypothetical protein
MRGTEMSAFALIAIAQWPAYIAVIWGLAALLVGLAVITAEGGE